MTGITVFTDYATAMHANELRRIHPFIVEDVDYAKEKWDEQSLTTAGLPHHGSRTGKVKWQMRDGYWEVFKWEGKHNKEILEVVSLIGGEMGCESAYSSWGALFCGNHGVNLEVRRPETVLVTVVLLWLL